MTLSVVFSWRQRPPTRLAAH